MKDHRKDHIICHASHEQSMQPMLVTTLPLRSVHAFVQLISSGACIDMQQPGLIRTYATSFLRVRSTTDTTQYRTAKVLLPHLQNTCPSNIISKSSLGGQAVTASSADSRIHVACAWACSNDAHITLTGFPTPDQEEHCTAKVYWPPVETQLKAAAGPHARWDKRPNCCLMLYTNLPV